MKHVKDFNNYLLEEESIWKNLFLSIALSLGLNHVDAQTIEDDSIKTEVIKDISNYNKILSMTGNQDENLTKLTYELSKKLNEPKLFVDKYLLQQVNGTFIVKPDFVKGLELHLRKNLFELGYNIKF
jgi:hypothetical protein